MLMSDVQITEALDDGGLSITPFDHEMLQPASYDLKVGRAAARTPSNGDDPRIDLEKDGVLLIPPYALAIVLTYEELRLSTSYAGHFGLKSKLARRGLQITVGLQVDPGFHGPLSVTMMNMSPSPITLDYMDDFLTLELEKLTTPASRPYKGEYQGKRTFTAKELDAVLGFKGHALSDVVKGFEDIRDAVKVVADMSGKLDTFMRQHREELRAMQKFTSDTMSEMKKLVEYIVGGRETTIVLRTLTHDEARQEILELFRSSTQPLYYSDIAERLQLDLEQVLQITTELEREGLIGEMKPYGSEESQGNSD